jgi:hypothetical protein
MILRKTVQNHEIRYSTAKYHRIVKLRPISESGQQMLLLETLFGHLC